MKYIKVARCPFCGQLLFKYDDACDIDISIYCSKCMKCLKVKTKGGLWE